MKRVLEADGDKDLLAPNGSMGLAEAHREHPDLILLDVYMPDLNGYEVARRLRQMEHTRNISILIVTASHNPDDKEFSIQVGCNGFISKPIDIDLISIFANSYQG